jgi:RNA polymerase sigma factor (sigma-70 family)
MTDRERPLDKVRPVSFATAYRMLSSISNAEDVVQEALLGLHQALQVGEQIAPPRAFAATVTTRLAINELRSARAHRERDVGEWLPQPIITDGHDDRARHAETADSLSLAVLVLVESLSPEQRAVLLLHDVFDYGHREITAIVGKSADKVRQLATRARRHAGSAGRASKRRASSATSWHDGSFRPPGTAISPGSGRCSLTTWSWPATAAARFRRSRGRCAGAGTAGAVHPGPPEGLRLVPRPVSGQLDAKPIGIYVTSAMASTGVRQSRRAVPSRTGSAGVILRGWELITRPGCHQRPGQCEHCRSLSRSWTRLARGSTASSAAMPS